MRPAALLSVLAILPLSLWAQAPRPRARDVGLDFALGFSTAPSVLRAPLADAQLTRTGETVVGEAISPRFEAVVEATEEAIVNSPFRAETVHGFRGTLVALPMDSVVTILREHRVVP